MTEHKMPEPGSEGVARESEHKDIAHPITAECRDYIQKKVLEAYEKEKRSSQTQPSHSHAPSVSSKTPVSKAPPAIDDDDIEL
jgi:hypothetical protein